MVAKIVASFLILLLGSGASVQSVAAGSFSLADDKRYSKEQARLLEDKAVLILRNIITETSSSDILQQHASVFSGAGELLWTRDENFARASFHKAITTLLNEYQSEVNESKPRHQKLNDLSDAISTLIRSLAGRDSALAMSLLKEHQKIRAGAVNDTSSKQTAKEKLEIIRDGLDLDARESARLAANLLKTGIPNSFPQYLYDLASRDTRAADDLYRIALTLVSSGVPYNASDANYLSAYAFREGSIILPAVSPRSEEDQKLNIGIFTSPLSRPEQKPQIDAAMAREYVRVMYSYFSKPSTLTVSQPANMARSVFLVNKLTGYVSRLKLDDPARWEALNSSYEVLARNNGLDDSNLKYLLGYAQRIANDQVAFLLDNGASLFRKAIETRDAQQRTQFLVRGIKELVEAKSYDEATRRIADIDDQSVKALLSDYVNFEAGKTASESRDWKEANDRYLKISDPQLRSILMLESARLFQRSGKGKRNERLSLESLERAYEDLSKVAEPVPRAQGLLVTASLMARVDPDRTLAIVNEAVEAINKAKDYDGENYAAQLTISSVQMSFILDKSDLESAFSEIAKTDWSAVIALIDRLEPKLVRQKAQIGACRTILG